MSSKVATILLPFVLGATLAGCLVSKKVRILQRKEGAYATGQPTSSGWASVSAGGADKAWWNSDLGATIYADSNCDSEFDNDWLTMLMDNLFLGIRHAEDVEERWLEVGGTPAFLRVRRGLVDASIVQVGAVVLKKDRCAYDVVLIATPEGFDAGMSAFWEVVTGFRTFTGNEK